MGEYLMIDLRDDFWDRDEYEYFCKLSDEDKLEYAITLFQLDSADISNEIVTKEKMIDYYDDIEIVLDESTISISSKDTNTIDEFLINYIMDGNLITKINGNGYNRKYKILGEIPPISLN